MVFRLHQIIFCVLAIPLLYGQAEAVVYRCVGPDGSMRFTDTLESDLCTPMDLGKGYVVFDSGANSASAYMANAAKYEPLIRYYAVRFDIDPSLIKAVIRTESGFNPMAVSSKGAKGLMQLMPDTARDMRVNNPFDPKENIEGGTRYLRMLLDTFQGDVNLALAAYNAGPTVVKRVRQIPQYAETQGYVDKVLRYYEKYKDT